MLKEFRKFILRGNVVDLAVGVIIGAAFNNVVQSLVAMITSLLPTSQGTKFANAHFHIFGKDVIYGPFVNSIISFLLIAAVVFFFVVQPVNKLNEYANRSKSTEEPSTKKCEYCLSEIPKDATRCKFCTSKLAVEKT
jgi:large conductance mechanosensitive channel